MHAGWYLDGFGGGESGQGQAIRRSGWSTDSWLTLYPIAWGATTTIMGIGGWSACLALRLQ